ncbi:hypothetical protein EKO04_004059 [Ascochyta lentis]|uniref:CCHC-type domain-containing protein n=1 Tax=Ascochyta lentis TaxID=205686 RepID=A0A8H7J9D8_9PLEO|nr:hypothetical protein EKO04_004059 [Ascochyta lentis]
MSWDTGAGGGDSWGGGADTSGGDSWGGGGGGNDAGAGGGDGSDTCRICNQTGHFARECPDKPAGGGLTGECFNCGEVGHNKADCTNPRVEREFTGTCNACGVEGHAARSCPTNPMKCKLCDKEGHKALECKERRLVDWTGVPELEAEEAWAKLIDSAKEKDLDGFRTCLKAYARSVMEDFSLPDVEAALREDQLPVHLIAKQQEVPVNMTVVDMIGNPEREFVLTIQLSDKPRRKMFAQGWPENAEQNLGRLASAGFVQDRGVPLCSNCGELGHIKKHCKQEQPEHVSMTPAVQCVYCQEEGHRARDCPMERINPHACKNCKQEGHNAKECPEPRSAEGVECRKCNETGHFSKDCPNVEARPPRTCRNCGSEDHIAKECDQPRNPDNVTCRNCEKLGHFSRDCPEPKDWSKVQCQNCQEFGHTVKRCKAAPAEGDATSGGGPVEATGGWGAGDDTVAAGGGEASWGGDSGGGGCSDDLYKPGIVHQEKFDAPPPHYNADAEAYDHVEEKRLVRKIDWRLLPILGAMYSISLIDRTDIANAR